MAETGAQSTYVMPTFLVRLRDPGIKNVLVCGCGGGFDFVHSMNLYPELKLMGKNVIIGSYSFGNPENIGNAEMYHVDPSDLRTQVKKVTANSKYDRNYGPEVLLCAFLDKMYPADEPHFVYAYYARAFTIKMLVRLYQKIIHDHSIDAIVTIDGGSDSLMRGDEAGLGDPVEDATSVATVASLAAGLKQAFLITIGVGCDRFNSVSDAATMRCILSLPSAQLHLTAPQCYWRDNA
eukprot:TRINITY_DN3266_c0_g1_i3.p1 TRINITY_DN3266_c0_g1~~TRINITY_DN3266_c0_g1_i3.p1  ORF type:complete len:236 (+),score=47.27 TRINITY_DN3266_c0_g1_i3:81-788(+)